MKLTKNDLNVLLWFNCDYNHGILKFIYVHFAPGNYVW